MPVLVQAGLKNTNRNTAMNAVANINTNLVNKENLINKVNEGEKKRRVRGVTDFNDAVAQGDTLIELKSQCKHGEWGEIMRSRLTVNQTQAKKYIRLASNKEYLVNRQSTVDLTIESADTLIKEKNKKEREAKLITQGKPVPEKKTKKESKKTLKEVGFDAPPTDVQLKKLTDNLRDCLEPKIKVQMSLQVQEWFTDECNHITDFIEDAAKKYTKKSLNAFARMLQYHDRVFQEALINKLPKEVKLYKKELEAKEAELDERERGIVKRSKRLKHILTDREIKVLKGCFHPDVVPEDKKEKFSKGFQILMKAI